MSRLKTKRVADILNEHFVSIKVDREELPDVDEQYMIASQLLTRPWRWVAQFGLVDAGPEAVVCRDVLPS